MKLIGYFSRLIYYCLIASLRIALGAGFLFLPAFSQSNFIKPEFSRIGAMEPTVKPVAVSPYDLNFGRTATTSPDTIATNLPSIPDQELETRYRPVAESVETPKPFNSAAIFADPLSKNVQSSETNDRKEVIGRFEPREGEEISVPSWDPFANLDRKKYFEKGNKPVGDDPETDSTMPLEKFHWKDAIYQSLMIQGVQHAYALAVQEKTRRALKGPFFKDYWESIRGLRGWDDGNKFFTNYIAHPMQGAMTGFIFLQNHDRMKKQKFGESRQYWRDRFKAFVWSTAWSTNWEIGPISQSSIGNVGLYGHQGYVDLVMTPTAGTGWMVMEEALDRYVIRHMENRNFVLKIFLRTLLNPMRSVANALRFKEPWYRDRAFGH